jgi:hypothetical protein
MALAFECDKCKRVFTEKPSLVAYTEAGIWGEFCSNCLHWLRKETKSKI